MELCANKFTTAITLQKNKIPTPRTALVTNLQSVEVAMKEIGGSYPVIAKTITGAEGIGVMKVESEDSLRSVLQGLWKHDAEIILQEYKDIEYDVRTLVLDGEIIASMKRISGKGKKGKDFRTNKSLGNETEPYELSDEEKKVVLKAHEASGCYYSGVDTMISGGKVYVIEVNGSPGSGADAYASYSEGKRGKDINGNKLISNILDHVLNKENWQLAKSSVGVIEWCTIEGEKFKAKLDTGNSTGGVGLHAEDIKVDGNKVSFKLSTGKKISTTIKKRKNINYGGGKVEERIYVELKMSLGSGKAKPTMFNLDNRSENAYDVLIDKDYLAKNNLVVDAAKKFTIGESTKRVSTFSEMYI
jgi:hypothetical protein